MTLQALADKIGKYNPYISDMEAGKRDLRISSIEKICEALDLEIIIRKKTMKTIETIRTEINQAFKELNDSANKEWNDERILENAGLSVKNGVLELAIFVGKWDKTLYIVNISPDGWRITQGGWKGSRTIEDVMHNVIMPMLPPERIEEVISE